jgi:hypothetical protein
VKRWRRIIVSWAIALAFCSPVRAQSLQQPGFTAYINGNSTALASAPVSFDSSGNNTIVAGATGKIVRVYRMVLISTSAVVLTLQDGSSNALTGAMQMEAGTALEFNFDTMPWFITSAGNGFVANLGSGVQVSGVVYYTQG